MSHREVDRFSKINPPVLEKMIRALALLEALASQKLNFIFKGGTSLILIIQDPRRFSVDIDIVTKHSQKELEDTFDKIVASGLFGKWELDAKRSYSGPIPKAHYSFFYESSLNKAAGYVLLDILFEDHHYPVVQVVPIQTNWIKQDGDPFMVTVPTIDSICGDKLSAFAPNTTGVLYGHNKSLEIVKQLHDVGHLFDSVQNIDVVGKSFIATSLQEMKYRALDLKPDQVLDDIVATALLIGKSVKHHSKEEKDKVAEIMTGIEQFKGYVMHGRFRIDVAVESAAKAAYLAAKIKAQSYSALERYAGGETDFQFDKPPYNVLNPLRKVKNGSIFYWSKAVELLEGK